MKDMRVAVKTLTFPLHSDEPPESTMSPVMTTSPLTLPPHAAQVPVSHTTDLYDAGYPSVAPMMKTVLQLTFHHFPAQCNYRTPWIFYSSHISSTSLPYMMTWMMMKKKGISKQFY